MDEGLFSPLKIPKVFSSLQENTFVFRLCLVKDRDKKYNEIPAIRCFTPGKNDADGLSVDWEYLTSPEESLARVGAQLNLTKLEKGIEEFKNVRDREIYKLQIARLKNMPDVTDVIYTPINESPQPKGKPNNPAHSSITFTKHPLEDECETLLAMRAHAVENKRVEVDYSLADAKAMELRKQWL